MRIPKQPKRLTILGGGYIGAELGHFFGALGTEVTIIDRGDSLIKTEDDDIRHRFTEVYSRKYDVLLNARATGAHVDGDGIVVDVNINGQNRSVTGDTLLIATGRIPNSDILDVTKAGIEVDERGRIVANDYFETNVPGIWAHGDVTSKSKQLKHMANIEARACAHNVTHPEDKRSVNYHATPHAVFGHPQVASVGMTEREAKAAGLPYLVGMKDYGDTAYGWAMEDTESFAKIIANSETRHILGAHVIGPQASLLIQPLINAMRFGVTVDQLARDSIYIHPALTEVIENALLDITGFE